MTNKTQREERVLVLAPLGRDAPLIEQVLAQVGIPSTICVDIDDVQREAQSGVGAVLLTEEVIDAQALSVWSELLATQPPWSDLPLVLLSSGQQHQAGAILDAFGSGSNVTILERPLQIPTLVTVMQSTLRARRRQYEMRDLLEQLQAQNESLQEEIDRRQRAQEKLHLARQQAEHHLVQLEAIIASMSEGLVIAEPDGKLVAMNPAALALHGYRRMGEAPRQLLEYPQTFELTDMEGEPIPLAEWPMSRALREEKFTNAEVRVRRKDTNDLWIGSYSGTPVYDQTGQFILAILTIRDVTAERRAEEALRISEERFRTAIKDSPIVVFNQNLDLRYTWIYNSALGYTPEDLLGKRNADVLASQEDVENLDGLGRQVIERGEGRRQEICLHVGDSLQYRDMTIEPLRNVDGRIVGITGASFDITDRKQAEEALRESEERFRVMAETIPDILFTCRPNGTIDYLNPRFYDYTGLAPDTALGDNWTAVLAPVDLARYEARWRQALALGEPFQTEFRMRSADGEYCWFVGRAHPIRNDKGRIVKWVGTCSDIHDLKEAEAALRRARDELESRVVERTAELSQVNASLQREIAEHKQTEAELAEMRRLLTQSREAERMRLARELHDGPIQELNSVGFELTAFVREIGQGTPPEQVTSIRTRLKETNRKLRHLCNDLRPPTLAHFGLQAAIRSHADQFQETYPELRLGLFLMEEAWSLPEELSLTLYRIYQQALYNVVQHAEARNVLVRLLYNQDSIRLEVEDDGCGFVVPTNWIELARQGHLGLVGMVERAEGIRGTLQVDSTPGQGTIVRVTVPRPKPDPELEPDNV